MNAGEIRTQDDAVKDTVQMTLMSACEGWERVSLLVSMAKVESTWKLEPGTQS